MPKFNLFSSQKPSDLASELKLNRKSAFTTAPVTAFTIALITIGTLLSFAPRAQASTGLYLEPGITYTLGNDKVNWPSPFDNSTGHIDGLGIMGRAGFHFGDALFVAVDGRYSMPKFTDSSLQYDAQSSAYQWGPVAGVQMPFLGLRIWGGYIVDAQLDPGVSGNYDVRFKKGTGLLVGAGFHISALSLNLEYQKISYGTTEFQKAFANFDQNTTYKMDADEVIASVTFPFNL